MRTALAGKVARYGGGLEPSPGSDVKTLPPPIGGWNRRDTLPLMDVRDAITLDNLIPDTTAVKLRRGHTSWATALSGNFVESLFEYPSPSGSNKLFAATPSKIYDVTAAGAGTEKVGSLTNGRWQVDVMSNAAGTFLVMTNGADAPRTFDGTTHGTASISGPGLTITNLISVKNHMNRLFFLEENQPHVWYLGTAAIAGTLTKFLPPWKRGGKCMAVGSWTRDGGAGPDDFLVFVSSKGECIIYAGVDLSSSTTSALVGIYNIPDVIGRRCLIGAGADLAILTMQGLVPLSQVIGTSAGAASRTSFTDKISGAFKEAFKQSGTNFGWEVTEYPKGNLLIVNVPIAERTTQHQYVMNINTGAWCRFTGINAACWSTLGNKIYLGGNTGVVYEFDTDYLDNGVNIIATMQSAYSTFKSPQTKRFTMARPLFSGPAGFAPRPTVLVDYDTSAPAITIVQAASGGTQWDAGQWDTFQWAGGAVPVGRWAGVTGVGRAGSVAFGLSSSEEITYNGCDVAYEAGNYL